MAGAVRNLMVRGGADFSKLDKALGRTGKNARSMQSSFDRATKGMQASASRLSGVLSKALALAGVASLTALSKQAIDTASDLEEVQNVVDTAFGQMAESAENFAKKAGVFNLSELQAKQTASTYMAMAKSLGLAEAEASKMSIAAAALTGDMSSFFNVSQDVASTAVKSIFTGETETLKAYGVVMSQAALEQYALEKGIKKTYATMTDAEKVALRYAFVMERLSYVQGDAEKTADSWANKTRKISERLRSILSIFGSGLIDVLSGPINVLDRLLDRLEYAAKLFKAITVRLYGDSGGSSGSAQMAAAIGEAAGSAETLEENIKAAGEAAKRATLPMDQLHKLSSGSNSGSSGNDSAAGALGDLGGAGDYYTNRLEADDVLGPDLTAEINARADKIVATLQRIKDKVESIKNMAAAKIGEKIDLEDIKGKVRDFTDFAKEHKNEILDIVGKVGLALAAGGIAVKVGKFAKTISLLGGPIRVVSTLAKGLVKTIGGLSPTMLLIGACVGVVVAALAELYQTNENVRAVMDMAWNGIKGLWTDVCSLFQTLWDSLLKPVFDELGITVNDLWADVILPVVANLSAMLPGLVALIKVIIQTIIDIIGTVGPAVGKILGGIAEMFFGLCGIIDGIIHGDWSKIWDGFKGIVEGAVDVVMGLLEGVLGTIKSVIDLLNPLAWGDKIKAAVGSITGDKDMVDSANASRQRMGMGQSIAKGFADIGDWWHNLTGLASGGVVYGDTVVRVGEYAGASTNPEIVAPQSIMRETLEDANMGVIDALYAMSSRVCKAIEQNRAVVNVGGKQLEADITRQQNDRAKMTGKSILAV